jgi:peptidoglycan/LPS O-acetylase OafA/YrhL
VSHSTQTSISDRGSPRLPYSPGFDGLRAVAALAVMLFHLNLFHVTGGFLGVSVFFCLSGFLITSLLLEELRGAGRIDLRAFWRRRVFRIMPLLATVTAVCVVWALFNGSELAHQTLTGALTSALFVTNLVVAHDPAAAGLLNGNWSVVFEEQFYLVWPVLLMVLWRRVRRETTLAWLAAGAALLVMAHRYMLAPSVEWTRLWFGPDTQVDAVLVGCAVVLGFQCRVRAISVGAGVALMSFLFFANATPVAAQQVIPATVVSTALLLPYLKDHAGVFGWRPLVALGKRSYGFYLWGGPIGYLVQHTFDLPSLVRLAVALTATLAVSEITYRGIEVPLRRLGRGPLRRSRAFSPAPAEPLRLSVRRP